MSMFMMPCWMIILIFRCMNCSRRLGRHVRRFGMHILKAALPKILLKHINPVEMLQMSKPISFMDIMVRKTLNGDKSQTRRVIKPQPHAVGGNDWFQWKESKAWHAEHWYARYRSAPIDCCAPYKVHDVCWVREPWAVEPEYDKVKPSKLPSGVKVYFMADEPEGIGRVRSGMYLPKQLSRITIKIIKVRVQRVQMISIDDIEAEGTPAKPDQINYRNDGYQRYKDFEYLWDQINGKWWPFASNPWVWVYEFMLLRVNTDVSGCSVVLDPTLEE